MKIDLEETTKLTVLVSGASGLIGARLCSVLKARGHVVRTLSRSKGDVTWDLERGVLDAGAMDGVDVVVHLAGEPVAQRWTSKVKQRILDSRVKSTQLLVSAALRQRKMPALVMASGSNFYGYERAGYVDEKTEAGKGFLADVCVEWEAAAKPLWSTGGRVVYMRTGMVLSQNGGALAKMLPPFQLGLGGRIGSGEQRISWVGLDDLVAMYCLAIESPEVSGPVNAVAPGAVTNLEFTRTLAHLLNRPAVIPVPKAMIHLLFGEMGKETVLADVALVPMRLQECGFKWKTPSLEKALKVALKQVELSSTRTSS